MPMSLCRFCGKQWLTCDCATEGREPVNDGPWQVGRLRDPQPDDPQYNDLPDVFDGALYLANADWSEVVAIRNRDGNVVWIFTGGQQFTPV